MVKAARLLRRLAILMADSIIQILMFLQCAGHIAFVGHICAFKYRPLQRTYRDAQLLQHPDCARHSAPPRESGYPLR